MRSLALLILLAASVSAWAAAPTRIEAEYQLTNRGVNIGRMTETYVRTGDNYRIHSVSRSEGLLKVLFDEQITLQSTGRVGAQGLQPLRFEERRTREPKRNVEADFDWERGVMSSLFRGEVTRHTLPPATQDRISMMYQFMHVTGRSGNLTLSMSNGRKIELYTY